MPRNEHAPSSTAVKRDETATACDEICENDQPTQGDTGIQPFRRNAVPLAAIGTDKRVCTASDELSNERIVKIPDTLINEIEIDVVVLSERFSAELRDGLCTEVRSTCG